jgi:mRNA-degrading endonuclease HigB of HigAB toxin-antitoxin module
MGKTYRYRGGFEEKSPVEFEVPFDGEWHAVIEKGTFKKPLEVKASAKLIKPKHHTLNGNEQMETHQAVEDEYDDTYE